METKSYMTRFRIFIGIWIVCLIAGAVFAISSPDKIFIAIPIWVIGAVCAIIALIFIGMEIQTKNNQKENRIKALEEEVKILKNKLK